jgi:hypothetical protein
MSGLPIQIEIRAFVNPTQAFQVELYAFDGDRHSYAMPLIMKEVPDGTRMEPFVSLNHSEGQLLIDSLYDAGLRPSQSAVKKDEEAIQKHLEDMREIAFGFVRGINHGRYTTKVTDGQPTK